MAGPRGETEKVFRMRRAQPLEGERQIGRIEIVTDRFRREFMLRKIWRFDLEMRHALPVRRAQPAVLAPRHLLDRGLAAQDAAAAIGQGAAAEIDHVGLTGLRLDKIGVAGALQWRVGLVARTHNVSVGVQFVGAIDMLRTRHRHRVVPARPAFGGDQIIPAVALVEMRRLGEAQRRAVENQLAFADQAALGVRIFLANDAGEAVVARPPIPELIDEILPPVVVVEQRGIEAARIHIDRIGPFAVDLGRGHEVVVEIAQARAAGAADRGAAVAFHVGINQPKLAIGMGQARRPHAAGIRIAAHVELAGTHQRPRQQAPVLQVARMVDLHARKPFEGRGRNVVVVADAHDRRIGVEALQDRVADGHAASPSARTNVHSRHAPTRSSRPSATKNGA